MSDSTLIRYAAGPWLGMVRGECLVVLPADASEETAAIVWDLMAQTPGVERLLATILSGRLDLTGLPSFALLSFRGGELHAILRGPLSLTVHTVDGAEQTVQGTRVATWNERIIPGVAALRFRADEDQRAAETLPLLAGAVRLRAVEVDLPDDGPAPAVATSPEPQHHSEPQDQPEPAPEQKAPAASEVSEPEEQPGPVERHSTEDPPAAEEPDQAAAVTEAAEPSASADGPATDDATEAAPEEEPQQEPEPEQEPAPEPEPVQESDTDEEPDPAPEQEPEPESESDPDDAHTVISPAARDAQEKAARGGIPGPQELIDSVPWLAAARQTTESGDSAGGEDPDDAATQIPEMLEMPADLGQTVRPDQHMDEDEVSAEEADQADTVLSPSAPAAPPSSSAPGQNQDPDDAETVLSPGAPSAPADPAAPSGSAVPPPSAAPPAGPEPSTDADETADHDGHTVMRSDLGDLADVGTSQPAAPEAPAPPTTGPMVLARTCAQGHANPPSSTQCAVCGQSLDGEAAQVRRPSLGRMRMSTGEVIELDRPVVIGRQPQANRVGPGTMPRMIQVRSPHGDISRNHCEVVLEGWHVQLKDLKATNGTVLIREGRPPRRLGQGEEIMLLDGDIADLGDGVSARFEGLW